jgi:PAS domain S-box-containing protein
LDGRVSATDRARELFGFSRRESIDLDRLAAMVHADDLAALRDSLETALQRGGDCSAQFRIRRADGTERWILARGRSEAGSRGSRASLRGVLRDVTDPKHAEAEAEELRRELTHIGRVTTLGQLASSLAHELSQPLGAILRNAEAAELLLQQPSPDIDELRAIITDIHRDDRRAGEVIERLRSLLQRRHLNVESIGIEGLVRDVSALVRPDAAARHILLRCEPDAGLPQVAGDRVHLSQVLLNLLVNALDATTEAKWARQVLVEAHASSRQFIDVVVTDGGPGIPPERLDRIFEPFYTTKSTGLGMGLAVSRTIVTAHGGKLWAENVVHGGARFHLVLPIAQGLPA